MGKQIIKQPNGKFCIFDSFVDDVIGNCQENPVRLWRG